MNAPLPKTLMHWKLSHSGVIESDEGHVATFLWIEDAAYALHCITAHPTLIRLLKHAADRLHELGDLEHAIAAHSLVTALTEGQDDAEGAS